MQSCSCSPDSGVTEALLLNLTDIQEGWWMAEEKGRKKRGDGADVGQGNR